MTDFDADSERQVDTFLLGELTQNHKSLRIEQNKFRSSRRDGVWTACDRSCAGGESTTEG